MFKVDKIEQALRELFYPEGFKNLQGLGNRKTYRALKHDFDIMFSILIFALFGGLCLLLVILKAGNNKDSAVFTPEMIDKNDKSFKMYKFRAKYVDVKGCFEEFVHPNEENSLAFKVKNNLCILQNRQLTQKLSLGELSRFWNALRGGISVVGLRPDLKKLLPITIAKNSAC